MSEKGHQKLKVAAVFCVSAIFTYHLSAQSVQTDFGSHTVVSPVLSKRDPFPVVTPGGVLSFKSFAAPSGALTLTLSQPSATQVINLHSSASAGSVLYAADLVSSSSLVVVGTSSSSPGAAEQNFLETVNFAGQVQAIGNLGAYTAMRVCVAPDSSYWTMGQELGNEHTGGSDYNILRHYSASGLLLGGFINRASLPTGPVIDLSPPSDSLGRGQSSAYLTCGLSSVGVYIGAPVGTWFELGYNAGNPIAHPLAVEKQINSIVLLSPGLVYAVPQEAAVSSTNLYRLTVAADGSAAWATAALPASFQRSGAQLPIVGRSGSQGILAHISVPPSSSGSYEDPRLDNVLSKFGNVFGGRTAAAGLITQVNATITDVGPDDIVSGYKETCPVAACQEAGNDMGRALDLWKFLSTLQIMPSFQAQTVGNIQKAVRKFVMGMGQAYPEYALPAGMQIGYRERGGRFKRRPLLQTVSFSFDFSPEPSINFGVDTTDELQACYAQCAADEQSRLNSCISDLNSNSWLGTLKDTVGNAGCAIAGAKAPGGIWGKAGVGAACYALRSTRVMCEGYAWSAYATCTNGCLSLYGCPAGQNSSNVN
jgi:hypothetical protein